MRLIKTILYFILVLTFISTCSDDDNLTEPNDNAELVGIWKVSKMTWSSPSESGSYSQEQLDSLGLIWQLKFNSDKTAEQITNLSGPTTTQEGTWAIDKGVLSLSLAVPTTYEVHTLDYNYAIENSILKLNWSLLSGTEYVAEFTKL